MRLDRFILAFVSAAAVSGNLAAEDPVVAFVSDQRLDGIFRIEDINRDGDTTDAGEVLLFFDENVPVTGTENSQGLYALGPFEVLATDNFTPDNVVLLTDADRNGDTFGAGESVVWFDGNLPGGFTLTNPVNLSLGIDDAFYMIDNNTLDTANPEAVYRLQDHNADDDVNDPNETTLYFRLSRPGVSATTTFDVEFDNAGAAYVLDITDPDQIESIDRINPQATGIVEWIDSAALFANTGFLFSGMFELTHDPNTDEIIAGVIDLGSNTFLMAFRDRNGSGIIDALNEVRIIWGETLNADGVSSGAARDIFRFADGSILFVDNFLDRIVRLVDRNDDGDYNDATETLILYDADLAETAGLPAPRDLLSIAAAFAPIPGDCDEDGDGDADDLAAFTGCMAGPQVAWSAGCGCADLDHDGDSDMYDVRVLQQAFPGN